MLSVWEREAAGRSHFNVDKEPYSSHPAYLKGWSEAMVEHFGSAYDAGLFMGQAMKKGRVPYNPFPKNSDEEKDFSLAFLRFLTTQH